MYRASIDGIQFDIESPNFGDLIAQLEKKASEFLAIPARLQGRPSSVKDMVDSNHVREVTVVYFGAGIHEDVNLDIPYVVYGITKW